MKKSKFIADLKRQCVRVGELRTAVKEGAMTEEDVYAEIGEVVNGTKKGREGNGRYEKYNPAAEQERNGG